MSRLSLRATVEAACPAILRPYWDRLEASPLASRLARGVFWSMAGAVISRGLMLVATVVVARLLGKTVFGELGMIQSTVGMFGTFAGFGLGLTATKHVAEFRTSDPARAGRILGLSGLVAVFSGGLMALTLLVFAPWLAEHTINAPHLAGPLRIGSLILFISALNGAQTGALSGFEAFKTIAHVNLLTGLLSFPILVAGAFYGGLTGAVWALAVNLAFNWLFNHVALRREAARFSVSLTYGSCNGELAVLWRFSLPAVVSGSMAGPVNWICSAVLANTTTGYAEMGIYSATSQWFATFMFLPTVLGQVIVPVLSEQLARGEFGQALRALALSTKVNLLVVLPPAILASVASPHIMSLFGADFRDGWSSLVVVSLTATIVAVQVPVIQVLAASATMWGDVAVNIGWAIGFILSTLLLVEHGSLGIVVARGIAYTIRGVCILGTLSWFLRRNTCYDDCRH